MRAPRRSPQPHPKAPWALGCIHKQVRGCIQVALHVPQFPHPQGATQALQYPSDKVGGGGGLRVPNTGHGGSKHAPHSKRRLLYCPACPTRQLGAVAPLSAPPLWGGGGATTAPNATHPPGYLSKLRGGGGGATTAPDATHPQLSFKTSGGGGGIGGLAGGGGAACNPLLPHEHLQG